MTACDVRLVEMLERGAGRPSSSYELARRLGVGQRAIGFIVNRLRREGYPIGSIHGEGYYLIETEEELEATIAHIAIRKRGIDQTIAALRGGFRKGDRLHADQ